MKSNLELQHDVQHALSWEPLLNAAEIGVTVIDGIVTLSGTVDSYIKKMQAEDATKRVVGVKALVENIQIEEKDSGKKTNAVIAEDVLSALKLNWLVPSDRISVTVEDGWVTLTGELTWNYQRETAKNVVSHIAGVKGVSNDILLKSDGKDKLEKSAIEKALSLSWISIESDIHVNIIDANVTLTGMVRTWYQKDEATRIAWNTPGVQNVVNELEVDYYFQLIQ